MNSQNTIIQTVSMGDSDGMHEIIYIAYHFIQHISKCDRIYISISHQTHDIALFILHISEMSFRKAKNPSERANGDCGPKAP